MTSRKASNDYFQRSSCSFADEPSAVKEAERHLQLYAQVFDYISRGVTERSALSRMLFILEILHKSLDVRDLGDETMGKSAIHFKFKNLLEFGVFLPDNLATGVHGGGRAGV